MGHVPTHMNIVTYSVLGLLEMTPLNTPEGVERVPIMVDNSNFSDSVQETITHGAAVHPCDRFPLKKI